MTNRKCKVCRGSGEVRYSDAKVGCPECNGTGKEPKKEPPIDCDCKRPKKIKHSGYCLRCGGYLPTHPKHKNNFPMVGLRTPPIDNMCPHCGMPKEIRNPSGYCDHLYYPDNCKTCKEYQTGKPHPDLSLEQIFYKHRCCKADNYACDDMIKELCDAIRKWIIYNLPQEKDAKEFTESRKRLLAVGFNDCLAQVKKALLKEALL